MSLHSLSLGIVKHWLKYCLFLSWSLLAAAAAAMPGPGEAVPSLAVALAPDGSLRPGPAAAFDARQFRMCIAPDGRPVFRPASVQGTGDERWQTGFGMAGPNNYVYAVARVGNDIYVGGQFATVGNVVARNVAKWDGTQWSSLGAGPGNGVGNSNGLSGMVYALAAAANGDVYVAGRFTLAGTVPVNHIAKWNAAGWSALGSGMSQVSGQSLLVQALAVAANGDLYAGGSFNQAGGTPASNIARWDGTAWTSVGTGAANGTSGTSATVSALAFAANGDLYAGGSFSQAGGAAANNVARWSGTNWSTLGTGTDGLVLDIEVVGNNVYLGGAFHQAGGITVDCLAQWNGTGWSRLGGIGFANGNSNGAVTDIAFVGNELYAGGYFQQAYGAVADFLAKWNGTGWSRVGAGISIGSEAGASVQALLPVGTELYVAGRFLTNGVRAENLAKWNGAAWSGPGVPAPPGHGVDAPILALASSPAGVYAGGNFRMADGTSHEGIARWNGTSWSRLATFFFSSGMTVRAIAVAPNGDVYAGGTFFQAGGVTASNVAKWNGSTWTPLATATGNGVNGEVSALALAPNGDLYVGGSFTQAGGVPVNNIAKWDGTGWTALGTGLTHPTFPFVRALALVGTELYAGGQFRSAGGVAVINLARWNGTNWSTAGSPNGPVYALATAGPTLYMGGRFGQVDGAMVNNVARWDGAAWTALGTGVGNATTGTVTALVVSGNEVCAGGSFAQAGAVPANNIARWDGTAWSALGTGTNGAVSALVAHGGRLVVGGSFTAVGDESLVMSYVGIYDPSLVTADRDKTTTAKMNLYPNPTQDYVTLTLPRSSVARPVELLDTQGQVQRQLRVPPGAEAVTVPVSGLPAGVYVLRCGATTRRVVVR